MTKQPARKPIALRVPPDLLAEIEAETARIGGDRHATILDLIRRGLDADEEPVGPGLTIGDPRLAEAQKARNKSAKESVSRLTTATPGVQFGRSAPAPGSRLKKR